MGYQHAICWSVSTFERSRLQIPHPKTYYFIAACKRTQYTPQACMCCCGPWVSSSTFTDMSCVLLVLARSYPINSAMLLSLYNHEWMNHESWMNAFMHKEKQNTKASNLVDMTCKRPEAQLSLWWSSGLTHSSMVRFGWVLFLAGSCAHSIWAISTRAHVQDYRTGMLGFSSS
jgi:hypothetical protein